MPDLRLFLQNKLLCEWVFVCAPHLCLVSGACGSQNRRLDPLAMWMLGVEPRSSGIAASVLLTTEPSLQPDFLSFFFFFFFFGQECGELVLSADFYGKYFPILLDPVLTTSFLAHHYTVTTLKIKKLGAQGKVK
jgi:hypothetical protein